MLVLSSAPSPSDPDGVLNNANLFHVPNLKFSCIADSELRPIAETPNVESATTSTLPPGYISRPTLLARTYDGKTIYLKRRVKSSAPYNVRNLS